MTHSHEDRPLIFYWLALIAVLGGGGFEIYVGITAGSPLNWSGGIHLSLDGINIAVLIFVHWWAKSLPEEQEQRFRLMWAKVSLGLIAIAIGWICYEAIPHLTTPNQAATLEPLKGAISDLGANIAQYLLLGSCACVTDRTGRLHAILDIMAAGAVILGVLTASATGVTAINPFASLFVAMIMTALWVLTWLDIREGK